MEISHVGEISISSTKPDVIALLRNNIQNAQRDLRMAKVNILFQTLT
jgi:hypothetical protein